MKIHKDQITFLLNTWEMSKAALHGHILILFDKLLDKLLCFIYPEAVDELYI